MRRSISLKFILTFFVLIYSTISFAQADKDAFYTVKNQSTDNMITLDATIEAIDQATLAAQTSGRVVKINFDTNDYVKEGDVLLEITNKEQGAKLAASEADLLRAKAAYNEARLTYNRYKKLFPKGAISKGDLDRADADARAKKQQIKAADAYLINAKESLKYTIVRAPFSGVVSDRLVQMGETVYPGQALFSGMSLDRLRAVSEVPQRYLEPMRNAQDIYISLPDGTRVVTEKTTLFNYATNKSHSFKVRLDLPKTESLLLPGMWVKVQFSAGTRQSIVVPSSSILTKNELTAVYLDRNGKAVLTQVRLGKQQDGYVEVLAGLMDGDKISIDAYKKLQQLEAK